MQRFYGHLLPGGRLIMPFMALWKEGDALDTGWQPRGEKVRESDGVLAKRWTRLTFDVEKQLEHTEDRYELWRDGQLIQSEEHRRSPATRWYTQSQVKALYKEAGFERVRLLKGFTTEPVTSEDEPIYTAIGEK
jgi:hypothetical protein